VNAINNRLVLVAVIACLCAAPPAVLADEGGARPDGSTLVLELPGAAHATASPAPRRVGLFATLPAPVEAPPQVAFGIMPERDRMIGRGQVPFETAPEGAFAKLSGHAIVHTERITLSDRVLFDVNRARDKSAGKERLRQIAAQWHDRPHWAEIHIEGHSDRTGPEAYTTTLSTLRAERVLAVLIELGLPPDALTSEGFGSSQRLDEGTTPEADARNRRVELVIGWSVDPRR
jgi:outer membrane protein OmpA-like peptidoglycan-associated protein